MYMAAGVLPYSIVGNQIYFLLGQEDGYNSTFDNNQWCEFGGSLDSGESYLDGAIRECYEESMGILGNKAFIEKLVSLEKTVLYHKYKKDGATFLIQIPFDLNLPILFSRFREYAMVHLKHKLNHTKKEIIDTGCYEKKRIGWFLVEKLDEINLRGHFKAVLPDLISIISNKHNISSKI